VILAPNNQQIALFIHADHALLDSLFLGVLLSHYWNNCWNEPMKMRIVSLRWPLGLAGLCLLAPGVAPIMEPQWFNIFGFILIYLGAGCLLLSCLSLDYRRCPPLLKHIARLGKYSYSVYLWHILAGTCLFPLISSKLNNPFGWILDMLIYFTLSWVVGIVMAHVIELPLLRIRDRFFPSNQRKIALDLASAPAGVTGLNGRF
jgi:peptidoglycan/LPS O-acetylase OafA/YrhL